MFTKKIISWLIYIIIQHPSSAPSAIPSRRGCHKGVAINTIAMPLDSANGSTMVIPLSFCYDFFSNTKKSCDAQQGTIQ